VILKTGSTLPELRARRGDFEDWIAAGLGLGRDEVLLVDVARGDALPEPSAVSLAVVTGSAAMVTDRAPWSVALGEWLARAIALERPTLGICYGHQLIADALGGTVGKNPHGREIGTVEVELTPEGRADPLLSVLADRPRFQATHLESVLRAPAGARILARNALDPVQAFAIGERAWCVQFHPECDADAIRAYIDARRDAIAREGLDPDALRRAAHDTDDGPLLLRRFAELAGTR
jgi:GMP synthase (glutamine-hydrolysing)